MHRLGNVLHDWPEKQALQILGNIRDAMRQGSKLFIWENMLPTTHVSEYSVVMDMILMANFSAQERTREEYEQLLSKAGFMLVRVWTAEGSSEEASGYMLLEFIPDFHWLGNGKKVDLK